MAKFEYVLQHNELFVMKNELVRHENTNGELILTNQNLVFIAAKGIFKTTYSIQKFPVNQIKVSDGKAQVFVAKDGNFNIYLINGQTSFQFWNNDALFSEKKAEKEATNWVNAINQLVSGQDVEVNSPVRTFDVGAGVVADAFGSTIDAFKGALGFTSKTPKKESQEKVTKKCSYCGASISGKLGSVARCSYCDADQKL